MHEMGIASSILDAVEKELRLYPGYRAAKVTVRIGEFAGVDGDSVRFCFDTVVRDSPLAPLELEITLSAGDELDLTSIEMETCAGASPAAAVSPVVWVNAENL